jgi:hypothetical protein
MAIILVSAFTTPLTDHYLRGFKMNNQDLANILRSFMSVIPDSTMQKISRLHIDVSNAGTHYGTSEQVRCNVALIDGVQAAIDALPEYYTAELKHRIKGVL